MFVQRLKNNKRSVERHFFYYLTSLTDSINNDDEVL